MAVTCVAVEIDTYDTIAIAIATRSLTNTAPLARMSGTSQFDPRLTVDVTMTQSISQPDYALSVPLTTAKPSPTASSTYLGSAGRTANSGSVEFAIDPAIYDWFADNVHWIGAAVRVYEGVDVEVIEDMTLVFSGIVTHLEYSLGVARCSFTDTGELLNDVFIDNYYDATALENLVGLPKPRVIGSVFNISPVLEADSLYRASTTAVIIDSVRVGGILWDKVTIAPSTGQWQDQGDGTFLLGGSPANGEVRCDCHETTATTTAKALRIISAARGIAVDTSAMAQLDVDLPYTIGIYTGTNTVNAASLIDSLMVGGGGYWLIEPDTGKLSAGVISAPSSPSSTISEINGVNVSVTDIIPAVWRIRIEHTHNWGAGDAAYAEEITTTDRERLKANGSITPEWSDPTIKIAEPRAIDLPLIQSYVQSEADAIAIRDRLAAAYGVQRRRYQVSLATSSLPAQLHSTVAIDYAMIAATTHVEEIDSQFGSNQATLRLWG